MKKTNTADNPFDLLQTYLREKKYSAAYGLLRRIDKSIPASPNAPLRKRSAHGPQ